MMLSSMDAVHVVIDQSKENWWDSWGASLIPSAFSLIVSLVALWGVVLAAKRSAEAAVNAEKARHHNALRQSDHILLRQEKITAISRLATVCVAYERATESLLEGHCAARSASGEDPRGSLGDVEQEYRLTEMDNLTAIMLIELYGMTGTADAARRHRKVCQEAFDDVCARPLEDVFIGQRRRTLSIAAVIERRRVVNVMQREAIGFDQAGLNVEDSDSTSVA